MDLIYINSGVGSVFSSQVVSLLDFYFKTGKFGRVILLCGVRNSDEKKEARSQLEKSLFKTIFYKTFPNYLLYNQLQKNQFKTAIIQSEPNNECVFHIRGEIAAFLAYKVIIKIIGDSNSVVVDIRGASLNEILEFQSVNSLIKPLKLYNNYKALNCLKNFKRISVVSKSLKEYILSNTSLAADDISVIPCLASEDFIFNEESRVKCREQLGVKVNECLMIFSSGGKAKWQKFDTIIKVAENGWKVLNMSSTSIDHPNIINLFVPNKQVPYYLSAADIAIIFREKSVVNKVASPVKFSEYLCCGLPVIADTNVDMITEYIKSTGHGFLCDSVIQINKENIELLLRYSRTEISEAAYKVFHIEKIGLMYLELYENIGTG
jgi:hypothetical protein